MDAQDWRVALPEYDSNLLNSVTGVYRKFGYQDNPRIIIYQQDTINASFNALTKTILISTAAIEKLNQDEFEAMIGHELGHRKHRDLTIAAWLGSIAIAYTTTTLLAGKVRKEIDKFMQQDVLSAFTHKPKWHAAAKAVGDFLTTNPLAMYLGFGLILGCTKKLLDYPLKALQRWKERQSDQWSADIVGKPEALITKFDKIEQVHKEIDNSYIPATDKDKSYFSLKRPEAEKPTGVQKYIRELRRSHPTLDERRNTMRERIELQKKQGNNPVGPAA